MKVLFIYDDIWHPADVIEKGLASFPERFREYDLYKVITIPAFDDRMFVEARPVFEIVGVDCLRDRVHTILKPFHVICSVLMPVFEEHLFNSPVKIDHIQIDYRARLAVIFPCRDKLYGVIRRPVVLVFLCDIDKEKPEGVAYLEQKEHLILIISRSDTVSSSRV